MRVSEYIVYLEEKKNYDDNVFCDYIRGDLVLFPPTRGTQRYFMYKRVKKQEF